MIGDATDCRRCANTQSRTGWRATPAETRWSLVVPRVGQAQGRLARDGDRGLVDPVVGQGREGGGGGEIAVGVVGRRAHSADVCDPSSLKDEISINNGADQKKQAAQKEYAARNTGD